MHSTKLADRSMRKARDKGFTRAFISITLPESVLGNYPKAPTNTGKWVDEMDAMQMFQYGRQRLSIGEWYTSHLEMSKGYIWKSTPVDFSPNGADVFGITFYDTKDWKETSVPEGFSPEPWMVQLLEHKLWKKEVWYGGTDMLSKIHPTLAKLAPGMGIASDYWLEPASDGRIKIYMKAKTKYYRLELLTIAKSVKAAVRCAKVMGIKCEVGCE